MREAIRTKGVTANIGGIIVATGTDGKTANIQGIRETTGTMTGNTCVTAGITGIKVITGNAGTIQIHEFTTLPCY